MILSILRVRSFPGRTGEIVRGLRQVMRAARAEKGFMSCLLALDADDANVLQYEEQWQTLEDFKHQVRSDRYTRVLELMESAAEQPSLDFHFVSETRKLDYIAEVRDRG